MSQAESDRQTKKSVLMQEEDKLREIKLQIRECKLVAPSSGMVVYYKEASSRFSSSNQGLIAVGEQVREGQKLLRIPDLDRMQVNTRIHEALISRIRGDERKPTGNYESAHLSFMLLPSANLRLAAQFDENIALLREQFRNSQYVISKPGQRARVRVDAMPDREFNGRVRVVSSVASMGDWISSDVKLYPTTVLIEDSNVTGLKPDMSAEVVIEVDPAENDVLAVPLQAIVGGAELGKERKVLVLENGTPVERLVELGMYNEKLVEVRTGLKPGDVVITNPKVVLGDQVKTRDDGAGKASKGGPGSEGKGKGERGPPAGTKKPTS
jgi:multidrug efflux pump subunit AcrA (membrane-fusion protein)